MVVIAEDLGLDEATGYRYGQTCRLTGIAGYLAAEQPGYWGLLTSTQLAGLCQEVGQALYTSTAGPLPTGWPPPTGCATRFRA